MATTEEMNKEIVQALINRHFYNPHDVFHHQPEIYKEPEGSKYMYRAEICKWNTRSARVVKVGIRMDGENIICATYKQGSTSRIAHGEKMR